jgi:molecular chaperone HscB
MQNHFERLGLTPEFAVDAKALEQSYFALQRAAHPDRQIGKSEAERIAAIEISMAANEAYDALKNPLTRAEHLLALAGIRVNSEEDTVPPAPALLMEMMELREQIADARHDGKKLLALMRDIRLAAGQCEEDLQTAFDAAEYPRAAQATLRLNYLGKAAEEAHLYLYRLKAVHQQHAAQYGAEE